MIWLKKKLKSNNNLNGSKLIDEVANPESADKLFKMLNNAEMRKITPEEALALIVEANLRVHAYELIREFAKKVGHDIYPSYSKVSIENHYLKKILNK